MRHDGPAVQEITAAVYAIPTDAPEADGTLAWDRTTMVLACARAGTARGIGWTYAAAAAQSVIADVLAGTVIGRSALDVPGAAEAMARAVRNIGRPGIAATAISAVDIALWANGGYTAAQAVRVADRLAPYRVTWFEEPVSSQDLAGLAAVRRQVRPDVAAGEHSWSLADSARLIEAGAVDCLQLDVTRCGGITEFLRGSALADPHNLQVSGHCAPNLHARVGIAVPNLRHVEFLHDHERIERMLFEGALDPAGGTLTPDPGQPGLGVTLREPDAERYRRGLGAARRDAARRANTVLRDREARGGEGGLGQRVRQRGPAPGPVGGGQQQHRRRMDGVDLPARREHRAPRRDGGQRRLDQVPGTEQLRYPAGPSAGDPPGNQADRPAGRQDQCGPVDGPAQLERSSAGRHGPF